MNRSLWRLLLACLLLLALPLKGVAAAGMAGCGTGHPTMGIAVTEARAATAALHADVHDHGASASQEASDKASHAQAADPGHVDHAADGGQLKAKCGGCAPCSMTAVPAGPTIARLPALAAAAEPPAVESHYLSVDLVGFERPPRPLRA